MQAKNTIILMGWATICGWVVLSTATAQTNPAASKTAATAQPLSVTACYLKEIPEPEINKYLAGRIKEFQALAQDKKAEQVLTAKEWQNYTNTLQQAADAFRQKNYAKAYELLSSSFINQLAECKLRPAASGLDWYLIGPFPNSPRFGCLRQVAEPEKEILAGLAPDLSKQYAAGKRQAAWRAAMAEVRDGAGYFDFNELFWPNDRVLAYGFTQVYSPRPQPAALMFGSEDGATVWLNGRRVYQSYRGRGYKDGAKAQVELAEGWNRLLVKVEKQARDWGFALAFCDPAGRPLEGLECKPDIITAGEMNLRLENVCAKDIFWQGQKLFTTRYFYFLGSDAVGNPYQTLMARDKNLADKIRMAPTMEDGKNVFTWAGPLPAAATAPLVQLRARHELADGALALEYEIKTLENIGPPPYNAPFMNFDFISESDLFWQGTVAVETTNGVNDVDLRQASAKPWGSGYTGLKQAAFKTPKGLITLQATSQDPEAEVGIWFQRKPGATNEPSYLVSVSVRKNHGKAAPSIAKGYSNKIKLRLEFTK